MKRSLLTCMLLGGLSLLLTAAISSCAPKRPPYGYDSQRWVPREHKQINFRTFTGYPRERGKRR
jgi:hypothetical protein